MKEFRICLINVAECTSWLYLQLGDLSPVCAGLPIPNKYITLVELEMLKLVSSLSNFHPRLSVIIKVLCWQSTKELSFLGNIQMIPLLEF